MYKNPNNREKNDFHAFLPWKILFPFVIHQQIFLYKDTPIKISLYRKRLLFIFIHFSFIFSVFSLCNIFII